MEIIKMMKENNIKKRNVLKLIVALLITWLGVIGFMQLCLLFNETASKL